MLDCIEPSCRSSFFKIAHPTYKVRHNCSMGQSNIWSPSTGPVQPLTPQLKMFRQKTKENFKQETKAPYTRKNTNSSKSGGFSFGLTRLTQCLNRGVAFQCQSELGCSVVVDLIVAQVQLRQYAVGGQTLTKEREGFVPNA